MFNFAQQFRTLEIADCLSAQGNHMGALSVLLREDQECDHNIFTCRCGERDWDLEAKDAELENF